MVNLETGELLVNEIAGSFEVDVGFTNAEFFYFFSIITTNVSMLKVHGDMRTKDNKLETCNRALATLGTSVYLQGKESKPERKVGRLVDN